MCASPSHGDNWARFFANSNGWHARFLPHLRAYTFDEVADAVDAIAGAIEVVGSRFSGGLAGKGRLLTTADFGANIALVVGSWTTDWRNLDLVFP